MSLLNYGNQFGVQNVTSIASQDVVNGLNLGVSGATFTIPTAFSDQTDMFEVAATAAGTVNVSGVSPQTINGATSNVTVTYGTMKRFYNVSGDNWISM